jgi:hypothetical protein
MLSSRLIQLIEGHWDPLSTQIVTQIRRDPRLTTIALLPESDLHDRARDILEHLGHWLSLSKLDELASKFEHVARSRHAEAIPLHELVLSYLIVKDRMLEFVRSQGMGESAVELYAEEELEHSVGRFFDHMIYHIVRAYERALAEAAAARTAKGARA